MKEPGRTDSRVVLGGFVVLYLFTVFFLGWIAQTRTIDLLLSLVVSLFVGLFVLFRQRTVSPRRFDRWSVGTVIWGLMVIVLFPFIDDRVTELTIANVVGVGAGASLLAPRRSTGDADADS